MFFNCHFQICVLNPEKEIWIKSFDQKLKNFRPEDFTFFNFDWKQTCNLFQSKASRVF